MSIGILTRNAGKLFGRVIDALSKQQTDWPFEVVVLDSASKDGTDQYAESRGCRVIAYRPTKFRFGTARDTLFDNCRGEVIVTISQDVVPGDEHWLTRMVTPILDGRADATVGEQLGPIEPGKGYVDCKWGPILIEPNVYSINVRIIDADTTTVLGSSERHRFILNEQVEVYGLFGVPHEWTQPQQATDLQPAGT